MDLVAQVGKTVLWSDESKLKFFLENWDAMSSGLKRTRTTQVVSALSSDSACISDGMGCMSKCWRMGSLHIWKGTINAWKVYPSSRNNICSHPDVVSFREDLEFSNMTIARPHTASITTSWECLRRRRIQVMKCRLQSRSFTHRKHLAHHKEEDATKKT